LIGTVRVQHVNDFDKVSQRPDLVDPHQVGFAGPNIGEEALQRGPLHTPTRELANIVSGQQ
jgi:hypothetical protein